MEKSKSSFQVYLKRPIANHDSSQDLFT